MYRQSINNIKVVIIPLDGTILDLNKYRYNYYSHLCDHKNISLDIHEFYEHLSSMYDMYKGLPLSHNVDTGPLNAKIEREMAQYLKYKGIDPKEGCHELIEYLHQKNIQIAVISTHRTKDAVSYLQMIHLYNRVHFIIGSDTTSLPLPSSQMLETIQNHFQVDSNEVLVLSSFMSLNNVANELEMNVIYCEDLVKAGQKEKETSYKVAHNLFEVLNILLFDRYEEVEMYSPILGMDSQMNKDELTQVKDKLEKVYQDDQQILGVIERTYAYHISQLHEQNIKDGSVFVQKTPTIKKFRFTDEEEPMHKNKQEDNDNKEEMISEPIDETPVHISPLKSKEDEELTMLLQQINKNQNKPETPKKITDMAEINQIIEDAQDDEDIYGDEETKQDSSILSLFVNILYILAVSFLVLFIGLIVYITFIHQFDANEGIFAIISTVFMGYEHFIELLFSSLFNGLHSLFSIIPSYDHYIQNHFLFSIDGVYLFHLYIFQTIMIVIIKWIVSIIQKRLSQHENNAKQN